LPIIGNPAAGEILECLLEGVGRWEADRRLEFHSSRGRQFG
jgi:hypothetical protein